MKQSEIENKLFEFVDMVVRERSKELMNSNYYIEASIVKVNDNALYDIEFTDKIYPNIKAREGLTLLVGDIVLVCVVNGNFSNKFIDLKRP